jgi:acetyl esterase/lipase
MKIKTRLLTSLGTIACLCVVLAATQRMRPRDVDALPSKPPDTRMPYGSSELQYGELRLPKGNGPLPVAIVIHGGCWVSKLATLQNTAALADALRDAGVATWNIEYRRLDSAGGGWPGTFADIADAIDLVRVIAKEHPLDPSRVVTVGHSAGAHLALWAAARSRLPKTSPMHRDAPLTLRAAVALGGPGDLRAFRAYDDNICGASVIDQLLGGTPESVPERYAQGSPAELLPLGIRQVLIVGKDDSVMPPAEREAYAAAVRKAGDIAEVVEVPGGHFEVIAPTSTAWPTVRDKVLELLSARQPADG